MMFFGCTQFASAQKTCKSGHCPKGYACVEGICMKIYHCQCRWPGFGCGSDFECAVYCSQRCGVSMNMKNEINDVTPLLGFYHPDLELASISFDMNNQFAYEMFQNDENELKWKITEVQTATDYPQFDNATYYVVEKLCVDR